MKLSITVPFIKAITAADPPEERLCTLDSWWTAAISTTDRPSWGRLCLRAAYLRFTMGPIHPSLSDLTQVPMAGLSHLHRGPRLSAAQDEKTVEALNFDTVKVGFGEGLCCYRGRNCCNTYWLLICESGPQIGNIASYPTHQPR